SPVNEFTDNLSWIHGAHTFKFGVNIRNTKQFGYNDAGIYQTVSFSTANGNAPAAAVNPLNISAADLSRFQSFYNDLLGRVSSITQTFYTDLQNFQPAGQ